MKKAVLLSTEENLLQTMNEDLLDRNKDLKNFCRLLQHQQGMSSIAIDGRWGSGKTFFVKQCALLLNSTNSLSYLNKEMKEKVYDTINDKGFIENLADNQFLAVYYDAWKNDTEKLDNRNQVKIKKISMIFHGFYCTLKIPEEKALFLNI